MKKYSIVHYNGSYNRLNYVSSSCALNVDSVGLRHEFIKQIKCKLNYPTTVSINLAGTVQTSNTELIGALRPMPCTAVTSSASTILMGETEEHANKTGSLRLQIAFVLRIK